MSSVSSPVCERPFDEPRHHCGLFGLWGSPDAAELTVLGLFAQQHRGQEAAGIVSTDGERMHRLAEQGLVLQVFTPQRTAALRAPRAIGHVRYSTTGSSCAQNAQPFLVNCAGGPISVAHNGNLVNAGELRYEYEDWGHIFSTSSDTEVILAMLANPRHRARPDPLASVLQQLRGAFSLLFLFRDRMVACRDAHGLRPLVLGRKDQAWVVASETNALDIIDAELIREVEPGEIVEISDQGLHSRHFVPPGSVTPRPCIFEQIYFADPSSMIFGQNVHMVRLEMGRQLARESHNVQADMVIPVPTCARCAAQGYHEQSGLPLGRGFTTSHYVGRSFIQPNQHLRDLAVRMKLNVIRQSVAGKRLIVVEDSIVRGTTTLAKMRQLRQAGVREIHLRVASPPIRHACYYGIDFPDPRELIANHKTVEQIRDYLGVDSLAYLSIDGMLACVDRPPEQSCTACFSGQYAIPVPGLVDKYVLERAAARLAAR